MKRLKVFAISFILMAFLLPGVVYLAPDAINSLNRWTPTRRSTIIPGYSEVYGPPKRLKADQVTVVGSYFVSMVFLVFGVYFLYLNAKAERAEFEVEQT